MPSAEPHSPSPYPLPQGERGRKSMFLTKYLPSPFSGRAPEKISPGPLGPGLTLRHIAAGSGEGWDPRDASVGPLAARGRGGAGPIRGPEARPTRGAEAFIRRSAPDLGSGPSNLARGRQRVLSLFSCPSRPPWGPLFALVHWALLQAVASRRHAGRPAATRAPGKAGFFSHD